MGEGAPFSGSPMAGTMPTIFGEQSAQPAGSLGNQDQPGQGPQNWLPPQAPQSPQGPTGPQNYLPPQAPQEPSGPPGPQNYLPPQAPQGPTGPQNWLSPQGPSMASQPAPSSAQQQIASAGASSGNPFEMELAGFIDPRLQMMGL